LSSLPDRNQRAWLTRAYSWTITEWPRSAIPYRMRRHQEIPTILAYMSEVLSEASDRIASRFDNQQLGTHAAR
jgi:hypothetical protein